MTLTPDDAKLAARRLARLLAEDHGLELGYAQALELVARQLGHADWNTTAALLDRTRDRSDRPDTSGMPSGLGAAVPVLRVQEATRAYAFYLDYLGFELEWEHRFEPGMPVYARLRRDQTVLDLSEHHGDGTPGSVLWVPVTDVRELRRELAANARTASVSIRPGIEEDAPGGPTMTVIDPYGNTLRFCQPA